MYRYHHLDIQMVTKIESIPHLWSKNKVAEWTSEQRNNCVRYYESIAQANPEKFPIGGKVSLRLGEDGYYDIVWVWKTYRVDECVVCFENRPRNTHFYKCKHLCVCDVCGNSSKLCPLCRAPHSYV
jgi:hypothetical protein